MKLFTSLVMLLWLFLQCCRAQDPQYSQFYHNLVYLNPALAGETRMWKFTLNSRMQWMQTPAKYVSNAFTAELSMEANNSAFGLQILHDKAGTGDLTYVGFGALYAFKARISRKMKINFGLKPSYNQRFYDPTDLIYASDIAGTGVITDSRNHISYFDLGAGAALVSRMWWVGFAIDHMFRPYYSFTPQAGRLPFKYSGHAMYTYVVKRNIKRRVIKSLVFVANYKGQEEWDQMDIGGFYVFKELGMGLFYRGFPVQRTVPNNFNQDAIVLAASYRWQGLKVCYSYDVTVSKLSNGNSGGSHELALMTEYPFKPKKRRRSSRFLPCPKF